MAYKRKSPIPVVEGGTGAQTLTVHGVLLGEATSAIVATTAGTNGQVLLGSTGADPAFITPTAGTGLAVTANATTLSWAINPPVSIANGGTNATSMATTDGTVYFDGTRLVTTATGTSGWVLTSGGAGVAPSYAAPAASSISITGDTGGALTGNSFTFTGGTTGLSFGGSGSTETVSGTLVVSNGGTGRTTLTNHGVLVGAGTTAITQLSVGTNGQVLVGSTSADPSFVTPTAGTGLTGTFNATTHSYALSTPVSIANGGTNATSMTTTDGVVYYDGTSLVTTTAGTSGQVLTSNGAGVAPTYQAVSAGSSTILTKFTSSGTFTINASTKWVDVYIWGGGAGGGSGRRGASTTSGGGGGGAGGGRAYYRAPATAFNASGETVTIGAGGNGGGAQTTNTTNGIAGSNSTSSSLGNLVVPAGGGLGFGGTTTTTSASSAQSVVILAVSASSGAGGTGDIVAGSAGNTATNMLAVTGGGGGGGADSGTARSGGAGGALTDANGTSLVSGGSAGIETGTINGGTGNSGIGTANIDLLMGGTGGGGGGGQKSGGSAGTGGTGGAPGGGGGGGGGSLNGTNSGAGGPGGRGEIWVFEYK